MFRFHKFFLSSLILDFIWQLIIVLGVNSFEINVEKKDVEFQVKDYFDHLEILNYESKGMKKYWKVPALKKKATEICHLSGAQLLTLCQWIATSETYKKSKFELTDEETFLHLCYPRPVKFENESKRPLLEMVTCPYIKNKKHLNPPWKKNELLSRRPGALFLSGSAVENSVLVFISRLENDKIICEPYGHVTQLNMGALKKVSKFGEAAHEALKQRTEMEDYGPPTDDSQEFAKLDSSERPLYFRDLL